MNEPDARFSRRVRSALSLPMLRDELASKLNPRDVDSLGSSRVDPERTDLKKESDPP
jgi:hypothetical protein